MSGLIFLNFLQKNPESILFNILFFGALILCGVWWLAGKENSFRRVPLGWWLLLYFGTPGVLGVVMLIPRNAQPGVELLKTTIGAAIVFAVIALPCWAGYILYRRYNPA